MSFQNLLLLAVAGMVVLAATRLVRVHLRRTPLPEGRGRFLFLLAFVVVPPIALGLLVPPAAASSGLGGVASVPPYAVLLAGLAILMGLLALVARVVAPARSQPFLQLALVGSRRDPYDVPLDPPMTARLAESVALVDRTNAVFPRGRAFAAEIDRAGFRGGWDALDAATSTLEGQIDEDRRLGLGAASSATATAQDARSRLDTLRRFAAGGGQAWAGPPTA
jgi:hypothetical protein